MIMYVSGFISLAINTLTVIVYFITLISLSTSMVNAADSKKLTVHGLFSDHAVFQRGVEVPVWGGAMAGATVKVVFSGQIQFATADNTGQWMVKLDPLVANEEGEILTVTSLGQTETRIDILVGEVWLASGQSNMSMAMFVADPFNPPTSIPSLGEGSFTPTIRLMQMEVSGKSNRLSSALKKHEKWKLSDVTGLYYFSSVGYYFARDLNQSLDVPIGIISSTGGGTSIRQWIPDSAIQPDSCGESGSSTKYNYSIAPLMPYAIKGVIWYQGEANAKGVLVDCYHNDLITLIDSWRSEWAIAAQNTKSNFPFYYVQLPNFEAGVNSNAWVKIREQMLKVNFETKNTEMVVSIDVGAAKDVHPRLKQPVGERLAKIARALDYHEDIVYSGPVFQSMNMSGNIAILSFNHIGSGLASINGQPLKYFEIAGADGFFHSARAVISGNSVEVSSNTVSIPVNVRYAWLSNPQNPNFANQEGLMATPFRTDAIFFNASVVAKPQMGGNNKVAKPVPAYKIPLVNKVTNSNVRITGALTTFDDLSVGTFTSGVITDSLGYIFEDAGWMGSRNIEILGVKEGYTSKVIQNSSYNRIIRMRKTEAEIFNLISFDYAMGHWGVEMDAFVTAYFQDGSTSTIIISSNTKKMTTQVVNWSNLHKVEFNFHGGSSVAYGVLDNFYTGRGSTSSNNKLVVQAGSSVASCKGSIDLDGIDDWVNIPDLLLKDDFTIEGWVFLASKIDNKSAMMGQEGFGPDINFQGGKVRLFAYGDRVVANTALRQNTWEHIAISRSGGILKLYINGVEDAKGSWKGYLSLKAIGRGNRGFFNGKLDEIRIWNVTRTKAEISAHYNKVVNPNHSGLIGYWDFNETIQTVIDASNAENHGSLGLTSAAGSDDPLRKNSTSILIETCE